MLYINALRIFADHKAKKSGTVTTLGIIPHGLAPYFSF